MNLYDSKIVVAIENAVCNQLEASGITADPFRLDGEKIIDVILEQIEGFVLVPLGVIERCISHIAIAQCHPENTREDDKVMDGDISILEKVLIEAQEQNHD